MTYVCRNLDEIKYEMQSRILYIHEIISLAFDIKFLIRNQNFDLTTLIEVGNNYKWDNLGLMLPYLPRELVIQYFDQLFEGFMDLNWSGSKVLYGYLAEMDIFVLKPCFNRIIRKAIHINDIDWLENLLTFMTDDLVNLQFYFEEEIELATKALNTKSLR